MSTRGAAKPSFEDWECPECANVNFSKRMECNRCRKPKPDEKSNVKKTGIEIGKQAAEKSKGLFSADDWMCTKCGNVNWARRKTCNTCNAPKFMEVEERTGLGGGFNEREGVEYKERPDSDSEYDDFGRKKKKFRGPNSESDDRVATSAVKVDPPKETSREKDKSPDQESEEEDEEDDDDDKIPSKYNLVDDDEEEENEDEDDDGDTDKYKLVDEDEETTDNGKGEARDGNDSDGGSDDRKMLKEKRQPRKRYPGSRSSESSSSSSSSRSRSSSSSSSSSSSRSSISDRGAKKRSRDDRR